MSLHTIQVEGMTCSHCVMTVEGALRSAGLKGKVNLKSGTVDVQWDDSADRLEEAREAIRATGYPVVS